MRLEKNTAYSFLFNLPLYTLLNGVVKRIFLFAIALMLTLNTIGQCTLYHGNGNAVANPEWVSCSCGT